MKKEGIATALARFFTFHFSLFTFHFSLKNKSQRRQPFFILHSSFFIYRHRRI